MYVIMKRVLVSRGPENPIIIVTSKGLNEYTEFSKVIVCQSDKYPHSEYYQALANKYYQSPV